VASPPLTTVPTAMWVVKFAIASLPARAGRDLGHDLSGAGKH
jgi:hypothetical protein